MSFLTITAQTRNETRQRIGKKLMIILIIYRASRKSGVVGSTGGWKELLQDAYYINTFHNNAKGIKFFASARELSRLLVV